MSTDEPGDADRLLTVFRRELRTMRRSRVYPALALGYALVVFGIAVVSGVTSYVTLALTLLTPLELLVPVLAASFGYRAVLLDRERGELSVIRTYPLSRESYVGGVLLARLAVLLVTVLVPLALVGLTVPFLGGAETFLPQPAGLDSPVLYGRFLVLTAVFATVFLALVVSFSTSVGDTRRALVGAVLLVLGLSFGADVAAIASLASDLVPGVPGLTAFTPNGVYRLFVLAFVVGPVRTGHVGAGATLLGGVVLLFWALVPLLFATTRVW